MTDDNARAIAHIQAIAEAFRDNATTDDGEPVQLFCSGLLNGLMICLEIIEGASAEEALKVVDTQLALGIGRAYLDGTLPPKTTR